MNIIANILIGIAIPVALVILIPGCIVTGLLLLLIDGDTPVVLFPRVGSHMSLPEF